MHAHMRVRVEIIVFYHNKNSLRFTYDSTFLRSHYLHPHPYMARACASMIVFTVGTWLLALCLSRHLLGTSALIGNSLELHHAD
jgi:hypothetical protein